MHGMEKSSIRHPERKVFFLFFIEISLLIDARASLIIDTNPEDLNPGFHGSRSVSKHRKGAALFLASRHYE
jgi:hypothetical protein